jgi:hypothetical protein
LDLVVVVDLVVADKAEVPYTIMLKLQMVFFIITQFIELVVMAQQILAVGVEEDGLILVQEFLMLKEMVDPVS